MRRTLLLVCVLLLSGLPYALAEEEPKASDPKATDPRPTDPKAADARAVAPISAERLMAHVRWLAAPERKGRGAWPDRKATADYIAAEFKKAGLQTVGDRTTMFQDKAGLKEPAMRNVIAWLPPGKGGTGDHVILSAHYDHLGQKVFEVEDGESITRSTVTYHGADDNASGVAALLEIARYLGARYKDGLPDATRGIMFIAFDLEEQQLLGSKHYVAHPWLPLSACSTFITMDMLGRSVADLVPGSLFAMGTENSQAVEALVRYAGQPKGGKLIKVGIDFQPGYSDYVPFMEAKIPYLFLTSGACEDYHRPTDVASRIQPTHLLARALWALKLTQSLSRSSRMPRWRAGVAPNVEEIKDLRALISTLEKGLASVPNLPPMVTMMVGNYGKYLDKLLADDAITKEERDGARTGALTLFRAAQQMAGQMRSGR